MNADESHKEGWKLMKTEAGPLTVGDDCFWVQVIFFLRFFSQYVVEEI